MERLLAYAWPGNVRELQNVMERAVILCNGPTLTLDPDLLPISPAESPAGPAGTNRAMPSESHHSPLPTLAEMERGHIQAALQQSRGVIEGAKGAARILNLHPNTLRSRMKKLGIERPAPRAQN